MKQIAVLLTCHNRKDKTLHCLQALYAQQGLEVDFNIEVFLVDDASTDGTAQAVFEQFSQVKIIQGDGNLYWNRGMYLAWQIASNTKDFDYYLWLNDDTFLDKEALHALLLQTFATAIVCGTTQSIQSHEITYGGFRKNPDRIIVPDSTFQECDYYNGNCVLIPRKVFNIVGNLDPVFHHAVGDFDYGLRAKALGIKLFIAPKFIGTCEGHPNIPQWRSPSTNILKRIKLLYSASSGCFPMQYFVFDRRHNGLTIAIFHFFTIHLRAFLPALWNQK